MSSYLPFSSFQKPPWSHLYRSQHLVARSYLVKRLDASQAGTAQVYHYSDCAWSQCAYQFRCVFPNQSHTFSCNRHVLHCLELDNDTILHNLDYLHAWPSTCHGAFDAIPITSQTGRIIAHASLFL